MIDHAKTVEYIEATILHTGAFIVRRNLLRGVPGFVDSLAGCITKVGK